MRRSLAVALCVALLSPACTALVDLDNQIIAEVDDTRIRLRHVIDRIGRLSPSARQAASTQAGREKILEDLINEEVLLREASRVGIEVSEEEIEQQYVQERQAASEANPSGLAQGAVPVLRNRAELQRIMTIERLTEPHLNAAKIQEKYEWLKENTATRYAAQYEFLWVRIGDTTFPRQIQESLAEGQSLQALARQHSRHPLFVNGGVSHVIPISEMEPWLRQRLVDAKPGDVLEPYLTEQTGDQTVMFVKLLYKWNFPPLRAIQHEIVQELYVEYLENLKSQRQITRFPQRLALIERQ